MMPWDVYFYEAFEEEAVALRRHLPGRLRTGFTWKTIQEEGKARPPAPFVSVRTQARFPGNWAPDLSGILTRSTGFDHVHAFWKECGRNVPSGYLPLYCHRSVAEHAMMMWMALLRKLPTQTERFARFRRDGITGRECRGKRLLVVGVGNIGYEVVRIGRGLDMDVRGVDLVERHEDVDYVSIDEGIGDADVVVCAMNLTEENEHYFHEGLLRRAKRGAVFINVARGEMSPSQDLLRLLKDGHLGGAGLDVFNREEEIGPLLRAGDGTEDPEFRAVLEMARRPDVIATPHNAFNTEESVERKAEQSVRQVMSFLEEGRFLWPVPNRKESDR